MGASGALQVVLAGDYATIVRADAPVGWWRLGDSEGYAQAVLSDEPQGYWRMNASSGTTETDRSGNGHNASIVGGVTLNQAGALSDGDAAELFNGSTCFVSIPSAAALHPGDVLSVEIWFKRADTGRLEGLFDSTDTNDWSLYFNTDDKIHFANHGVFVIASSPSTITDTNWHHVVATKNGVMGVLYLDGVAIASNGSSPSVTAGSDPPLIGAFGGAPNVFSGLLDEAAFYNYALSAQQVANHYALRTSTIATVAKATVADATGNGHVGTIVGGVTFQQTALQPDGNAAALFDGATGCAFVPDAVSLEIVGSISLEAWVKYTSTVSNGFIISKSAGGTHGYELFRQASTGQLRFSGFGTTLGFDYLTTASYNDGAWHHVVATWDGANGHIYVDGVAVSISTVTLTGGLVAGTEPLLIGGRGTGGVATFNGSIDEVAVYPTVLTPTQILNHYLAGQWTDITTDLTNADIAITRGFQSTAPDDLVAAPATLSVGLNNSIHNSGGASGYYSPDSSNLRPGFRTGILCRFRTTTNGNTRTRFYGWIQKITPLAGTFDEQSCAVTAASWMQMASSTIVAGIVAQINQRGDQLTATLAALATYPPFATAFSAGADTYPYAIDDLDPTSSTIVDGFDSIAKSGLLDRIWEQADGTLVFENRWIREQGVATLLTLTDVAPGGSPGQALIALPATRDRSILMNRFQVTVHPKRVDNVAVILYAYQTSASAPLIAAGATVTIQAPFVDPSLQSNKVGGFNTIIDDGSGNSIIGTTGPLPAADWQMTSATGGAGVDLSSHFTVSVTYSASQASFSITNTGTLAGFISRLQCRGQGIYDYQVIVGIATNASSQTQQSQLTTQVDCPYQPDPNFAQLAAQYLVLLFGTSLTTLDQGVQLFIHAGDDATMDGLLQREISDPIAITETVTGLSANQYWINAIKETYDERMNLSLTWSLQLRDTNQYWILGEAGRSELGNTTLMGYV